MIIFEKNLSKYNIVAAQQSLSAWQIDQNLRSWVNIDKISDSYLQTLAMRISAGVQESGKQIPLSRLI